MKVESSNEPSFDPFLFPSSATSTTSADAGGGSSDIGRGSGGSGGGGGDDAAEWAELSAKELKALLGSRNISAAGCLDKADLLAKAREHRSTLLAAVPVATPPSAAATRRSAEQEALAKRKKAALEALGGVLHGGYQVDLFGTKRGRCGKYTKCYRYQPANARLNSCAQQSSAAVTCQRCGHSNLEHEDLGRWAEGEPQLLDEHGQGWVFENGLDGVRQVRTPS